MELSNSNIKKLLIFSQKKAVLIFQGTEAPKKFLIFQETELFYISENGKPKKLIMFQEVTFRARKIKNVLYFGKWNFLATSLKIFFYSRKEL